MGARGESPLEESRVLAALFESAGRESVEVVVGGPYPPLTEQVLLDALVLARSARLSGLRVVIVSPEPPAPALRAALEASAVAWAHARWRDAQSD